MRVLFLIILSLMFNSSSWAYLTAGKIAVTATSSSSGVPSTSQDSDITDTKGTSVSVAVPVAVTGNMNISGTYQINGTPISATSNWNQTGNNIYYNTGNVGVGSVNPGQNLDVVGTVRATSFTGQNGSGLFGIWVSDSVSTIYQAPSDGFIVVDANVVAGTNAIQIVSDSSATPSTNRGFGSSAGRSTTTSFVRKGDYWEVIPTSSPTINNIYFLPIGS